MKGDDFLGYFIGLLAVRKATWIAEEDTIEGHLHRLRQRVNEHDDVIQKHIEKMDRKTEEPV